MRSQRRLGVTLVEMVAVLALTALTVGTMVVVFKSPHRQATYSQLITRLTRLDRLARMAARREGGVILEIVPNKGEAIVRTTNSHGDRPIQRCVFGEEARISVLGESGRLGQSAAERNRITYDRSGHCRSYGIAVEAEGMTPTWIYVVGGTGQKIVTREKKDIDALIPKKNN